MSWGGKRPGAGRKPKSAHERAVTGRPPRARVLSHPSAVPTTNETSPIEEFDAPDDLTREERQVWLKQAPHVFRERTLTRATAMAFERYCRMVIQERHEAKSSSANGPNHRGLRREINTLELQFRLTPCGKAVYETASVASPVNPLERFLKKSK